MAEWFAPKRFGWGSGRPVTWQGWAVTLAYLAVVVGAAPLLQHNFWAAGSIIFAASVGFIVVLTKTTQGGWRWGGDK